MFICDSLYCSVSPSVYWLLRRNRSNLNSWMSKCRVASTTVGFLLLLSLPLSSVGISLASSCLNSKKCVSTAFNKEACPCFQSRRHAEFWIESRVKISLKSTATVKCQAECKSWYHFPMCVQVPQVAKKRGACRFCECIGLDSSIIIHIVRIKFNGSI